MNVSDNIAKVNAIYAAFGHGDVPTILEQLHPEVQWELPAQSERVIPWLRAGIGKDVVARFFETVFAELSFEVFEVTAVMGDGPWVVALCRVEATHRGTGRRIVEACEPQIWHFDDHGRVDRFRHAADTLHQAEAAGLV